MNFNDLQQYKAIIQKKSFEEFYNLVISEFHKNENELLKEFQRISISGIEQNAKGRLKQILFSFWPITKYLFVFTQTLRKKHKTYTIKSKYPFENQFYKPLFPKIGNESDKLLYDFALDIYTNIDNYIHTLSLFNDEESKKVLLNLINFRLTSNYKLLLDATSNNEEYFDKDIITFTDDLVFCDVGGYIGDTSKRLLELNDKTKKIYFYEPVTELREKAIIEFNSINKSTEIVISDKGVSDKEGIAIISNANDGSSLNKLSDNCRTEEIKLTSLDIDITEPVNFVKMDIEGEEMKALNGMAVHIKTSFPTLAISAYHRAQDLWEIPVWLEKYKNNYNFFIRHYSKTTLASTVIYAVPKKELANEKT